MEGGEETSRESWDEHTDVSENPKGKSENPVGHFTDSEVCLSLGENRIVVQARQRHPGLLGGDPHNPKSAATWMNKESRGIRE